MATFGESLRDTVERKTGIIGQVLRDRREKQEDNQQVERQVARVEQTTQAIRMTGATLTHIEVLFTQISKNFQAINESFGVLVTLQDDTSKVLKEEAAAEAVSQQRIAVGKVQPITADDDDFSLLDLFNPLDLLDDFDRRKKGAQERKKKREAARKKRQKLEEERKKRDRAKAEQKEVDKNKEKTRAKAEADRKAAKDKALKDGKSLKDAEKAGAKAAKKVVKKANADAVRKVARKFILARIGKVAVKSIPVIGTIVGAALLVDAMWEALSTKNYTQVGAEVVGLVPIAGGLAGAIAGATGETYRELYGTDYLTDRANGVEGADAAFQEAGKIVKEEFEKAVKEKLAPSAIVIQKARSESTVEANARIAAEAKAQGKKQEADKQAAKQAQKVTAPTPSFRTPGAAQAGQGGYQPAPVTAAQQTQAPGEAGRGAAAPATPVATARPTPVIVPAPSARQAPVEQIREVAKQKAETAVGGIEPLQKKISPAAGRKVMLEELDRQKITDPVKRAAIMAQAAVETGGFNFLSENLAYSLKGLKKTFERLQGTSDDALKEAISRGVEGIGSLLYGGDPSSPSYKFGVKNLGNIQLTGRANYKRAGAADAPQKLLELGPAAETAVSFANQFKGDFRDVKAFTKFVNGGQSHVKERGEYFEKFLNDPSIIKAYPSSGAQVAAQSTQVAAVKTDNKIEQAKNLNVIAINQTNNQRVPA